MADEKAEDSRRPAQPPDFQQLIKTHGDRLIRSACLLCGDVSEAQDLVQETFLQALKAFRRFRGESSDYTWLYGILRNLCFRHFRHRKRHLIVDNVEPEEAAPAANSADSDADFRSTQLSNALQLLSPEHREAVLLRYYEGLKIEDIAVRTGVSKGTVKSRLHYAVRALRLRLPEEMNLFVANDTNL